MTASISGHDHDRTLNELEAAGLIPERTRQYLSERLGGWKDHDISAFTMMVERFIDDLG